MTSNSYECDCGRRYLDKLGLYACQANNHYVQRTMDMKWANDVIVGLDFVGLTLIDKKLFNEVVECLETEVQEFGGCDHAVNICICGMRNLLERLKLVQEMPARAKQITGGKYES